MSRRTRCRNAAGWATLACLVAAALILPACVLPAQQAKKSKEPWHKLPPPRKPKVVEPVEPPPPVRQVVRNCECHWWARDDAATHCRKGQRMCFKFIEQMARNQCSSLRGLCDVADN